MLPSRWRIKAALIAPCTTFEENQTALQQFAEMIRVGLFSHRNLPVKPLWSFEVLVFPQMLLTSSVMEAKL